MTLQDNSDGKYISGSIKFVSDIQKERLHKEKSKKIKKMIKNIFIVVIVLVLISGIGYLFITGFPMSNLNDKEHKICNSNECFLPAIKNCTNNFFYSNIIKEKNLSENAKIISRTQSGLCKVRLLIKFNEETYKGICFFPSKNKLNDVKAEPSSMGLICKNRFNYFFSSEK